VSWCTPPSERSDKAKEASRARTFCRRAAFTIASLVRGRATIEGKIQNAVSGVKDPLEQ